MKHGHLTGSGLPASDEADVERRAFSKIAWRILPVLILSYIFNYIDRTNIAVAGLTMNHDIGLSASEFGYGAGILFLGYCLFEVPSNLALYRFGARLWIARIMISWGLISGAMMFVSGPKSFYLLRFMLGVAEAGFFPGVAYYLSSWFPAAYRARIIGWFLVAIPASSLVGSPLSAFLMRLDGTLGIAGWKWLYMLESIPCILLGFAVAFLMTEKPEDARWLSAEEREVVVAKLRGEKRVRPVSTLLASFTDRRVWLLSGIYLGFSIGSYGIQIWLPLIIKQAGFSNFNVGLLTAIPYLFSVIGMILWASSVDRYGRRINNVVIACLLGALGFFVALKSGSFAVSMVGLSLALVGVNSARAVFWAIPPRFLTGIAAAGGLALINSIGTAGGFVGPSIIGWLKQETGSFTAGLMAMCGFLLVAAFLSVILRYSVEAE
jgi:ACS family tartrate transporter-like MFS transporter